LAHEMPRRLYLCVSHRQTDVGLRLAWEPVQAYWYWLL
jgi:hypothetical protein